MSHQATGYLHGYSDEERSRLHRQASVLEPMVHARLPFADRRNLLEIGSGVGAQTEILLRDFPELHVTGVEINEAQIEEARRALGPRAMPGGPVSLVHADATKELPFPEGTFDSAFCCWVLEHVGDPLRVLRGVRRVLAPGSPIALCEVMNATIFMDPPAPRALAFWNAYNDHQVAVGGDPFVGARLGNLLDGAGFSTVEVEPTLFLLDDRDPARRVSALEFMRDLMLSAAPGLLEAQKVDEDMVQGVRDELARIARPGGVFFLACVKAWARA